jgi:hypothetical protein
MHPESPVGYLIIIDAALPPTEPRRWIVMAAASVRTLPFTLDSSARI